MIHKCAVFQEHPNNILVRVARCDHERRTPGSTVFRGHARFRFGPGALLQQFRHLFPVSTASGAKELRFLALGLYMREHFFFSRAAQFLLLLFG